MGDEPKVELKCLNLRSSDPMKGVAPFRQQKEIFSHCTAEQCMILVSFSAAQCWCNAIIFHVFNYL